MSEGNFPAQFGESLFIGAGITTGGQLHSLIQPGSITHDSPTFLLEKRINPESCRTFSPTVYPRCGGAVTGAVGGAMYGSQLSVYMGHAHNTNLPLTKPVSWQASMDKHSYTEYNHALLSATIGVPSSVLRPRDDL